MTQHNDRALSLTLACLSYLPLPVLYALGRVAAVVALTLQPKRVKAIEANLEMAFPELNAVERRRLARAFVHNFADVAVETIKACTISKDELNDRVRITNIEAVEQFAREHQSIILIGSHEANWEWVLLACSSQLTHDIQAAYKPPPSAGLHAFLRNVRTRFGASLFATDKAAQAIIEGRKKLRAIAIIGDEKPSKTDPCRWTTFLNQETAFRTSFETLAELWRYPVVFVSRKRTSRGRYEVTFVVLGKPPYDTKKSNLVEAYASALQSSIRARPADWLWTQRRWSIAKPDYN